MANEAGNYIGVNFENKQQGQVRAIIKFISREKWHFNLYMQEPHILTPCLLICNADNGTEHNSEDNLNAKGLDVDVSDLDSSSVSCLLGGNPVFFFPFTVNFVFSGYYQRYWILGDLFCGERAVERAMCAYDSNLRSSNSDSDSRGV